MSGMGVSEALVEGCSGALGSVIALLATYPLKTIYTLQALSTESSGHLPISADPGGRVQAVLRFLQQYKLSTLYAGMGPNIVESALSSGVYFFFYSKLREAAVALAAHRANVPKGGQPGCEAEARSKNIGVLESLLVATVAGAINQLITMPASVVATRMQGYQVRHGEARQRPTTRETIAAVFHEGGLGAFWKGLLPSMILLANPAVQYMLFEKIKATMRFWKAQRAAAAAADAQATQALLGRRTSADSDVVMVVNGTATPQASQGGKAGVSAARWAPSPSPTPTPAPAAAVKVELTATEVFLAGALAKIGATVVTYPLIVIKARMQASTGGGGKGSAGTPHRASTWAVVTATARHEGLGGFFKGLRAKILQTALNAALMLMLKEQLHEATRSALCACAAPAPAGGEVLVAKAPAAAGG